MSLLTSETAASLDEGIAQGGLDSEQLQQSHTLGNQEVYRKLSELAGLGEAIQPTAVFYRHIHARRQNSESSYNTLQRTDLVVEAHYYDSQKGVSLPTEIALTPERLREFEGTGSEAQEMVNYLRHLAMEQPAWDRVEL